MATRCCFAWAYSEEPILASCGEFALASLLALPIVVALVGFGSYLLAKRALTPLEEMACRAEAITSERLNERLPIGEAGDEMDHLATVFNNLLARLEQSFEQLRRFTSDASHELRTPLASIRSVGEVALEKDGTRAEYRDTIGSMLEEVNRLTALVDNLLTIARADAGRIPLHPDGLFGHGSGARGGRVCSTFWPKRRSQRITVQGDERLTSQRGSRLSPAGSGEHHSQRREAFAGWWRDFGECLDRAAGRCPPGSRRQRTGHRAGAFREDIRSLLSRRRIHGRGTAAAPDWASRLRNGPCECTAAKFSSSRRLEKVASFRCRCRLSLR